MGNHVMTVVHDFYWVIMSSLLALCRLLYTSVKKEKCDFHFFHKFSEQYIIIKQLLDSVFVKFRIIKVLVAWLSASPLMASASADNP